MGKIKSGTIEVHGLRELNAALKKVEGGTPDALRETNKKVATGVATKAQGRAYGLGGVAAHVAPSLSARAGATSASVAGGGAAHPAFGGAEFGGRGRPTTQQFQPHRGDQGYFLFPTLRDEAPNIENEYRKALDTLVKKAGLG